MVESDEERRAEDVAVKDTKSGGGDQKGRDKKPKKKFATKVCVCSSIIIFFLYI